MFQLTVRQKVTYFILAASVLLLLAALSVSAPVFADCTGTSTTSCTG